MVNVFFHRGQPRSKAIEKIPLRLGSHMREDMSVNVVVVKIASSLGPVKYIGRVRFYDAFARSVCDMTLHKYRPKAVYNSVIVCIIYNII